MAKFSDEPDPRKNRPPKHGVLAAVFGELRDIVRFCLPLGAKVIVGLLFLGQSSLAWEFGPRVGMSRETLGDFGICFLFLALALSVGEYALVSRLLGIRKPWPFRKGLGSLPSLAAIWCVFTLLGFFLGISAQQSRREEQYAEAQRQLVHEKQPPANATHTAALFRFVQETLETQPATAPEK